MKNIIQKLPEIKYFIGFRKGNGQWEWSSNKTTVDSIHGKSPWVPGQPSGASIPDRATNCATIYGKHRSYLMSCHRRIKITEHICQRAVNAHRSSLIVDIA